MYSPCHDMVLCGESVEEGLEYVSYNRGLRILSFNQRVEVPGEYRFESMTLLRVIRLTG